MTQKEELFLPDLQNSYVEILIKKNIWKIPIIALPCHI